MVAENAEVDTHVVEHFLLGHTPVEIEVERALHSIAGIDEKNIRLGPANAVDYRHAAHCTAVVVTVGIDLRVGVVGVQNHQLVVFFRLAARRGNDGCREESKTQEC